MQLMVEDVLQRLLIHIAVKLCEISRELDVLRAGLHAVLAVAAAGDAAFFHQGIEALGGIEFSQRMQVEKICLNRRGRADEVGLRANVGTCFHAAAAGHAVRNLVSRLCGVRVLNRCILNFPSQVPSTSTQP